MNFIKTPTAGTPYQFSDIARGLFGMPEQDRIFNDFKNSLREYLEVDNAALVNSGTTANYILYQLFKQLRASPEQNEVIMSAYTAPSLMLPICEAGLRAVLVDTDPHTFNMDIRKVEQAINKKTLAIMPIHMFGIPCETEPLMEFIRDKNIFVLEDAASSLGSQLNNKQTGSMAPFGFYSFNRGKNISTLAGGLITWQDPDYNTMISDLCKALPPLSLKEHIMLTFKMVGLALAVRPIFYTLLNKIIAKYKYTTLHTHFDMFQYSTVQAALGKQLWQKAERLTALRVRNGNMLYDHLRQLDGIQLPAHPAEAEIAYNQFPIIIHDLKKRAQIQEMLWQKGIETSLMYEHPLHHIYPELNPSQKEVFPEATYLAKHLLLIPPHAQISTGKIKLITNLFHEICA